MLNAAFHSALTSGSSRNSIIMLMQTRAPRHEPARLEIQELPRRGVVASSRATIRSLTPHPDAPANFEH